MHDWTKTVLIVDDDGDIRRALTRLFHAAGFAVLEAKDIAEAREQIRDQVPDVVLLDLELGPESGDDFAFDVDRAAPPDRPVPIVVLSAVEEIEANWRATQIDAVHCIEKPCEPERIVRVATRAAYDAFPPTAPRHPLQLLN